MFQGIFKLSLYVHNSFRSYLSVIACFNFPISISSIFATEKICEEKIEIRTEETLFGPFNRGSAKGASNLGPSMQVEFYILSKKTLIHHCLPYVWYGK